MSDCKHALVCFCSFLDINGTYQSPDDHYTCLECNARISDNLDEREERGIKTIGKTCNSCRSLGLSVHSRPVPVTFKPAQVGMNATWRKK